MKFVKIKILGQFMIASAVLGVVGCTATESETSSSEEMKADASTVSVESTVLASVAAHLVDANGNKVDAAEVAKAPYLLFYFSAHWCPPCRLFTPKLVELYNSNGGGEKFEIIFVSSDKTEDAMYDYMKGEAMPWAAVDYSKIKGTGIKDFGGPYIPSLVMFDSAGKLVIGTDYDKDIEPAKVLEKLSEML